MKTTKLFAALGMAAALFTGCSSEESTTDQGTTPNGITVGVEYDTDSVTRVTPATESVAVYDEEKGGVPVNLFDPQWSAQGADTRMTHDDGTNKFLWEGTDKLGLLYTSSSASSLYTVDYLDLKSGATTNEAKFFRMLNLTFWGDPNAAATYYFLPFYPYETKYGATTWNGTAGDATTKQYIDADQGDGTGWKNYAFATAASISIVPSITSDTKKVTLTSGALKHKNTYVKFTVRSGNGTYTGKSVKSIKIEAPSTIAGTCWLGFSGSPSWVSGTESSSITLSNAGAFQGTIQTTCTNLGNYKYNTAYSAQGSMMVIKAGSFKPVITVTLTDNTELQRTMTNAIDFKAGYLRIVNLNLDDFKNTKITKFVSSNTAQGTVQQPTVTNGSVAAIEAITGGYTITPTSTTPTYGFDGTPIANSGYTFTGWTVSGATGDSSNNGTFDLGTAKTVTDLYTINADGSIVVHTINAGGITFTANFVSKPSSITFLGDTSKGSVPQPTVTTPAVATVTSITSGYEITPTSTTPTYGFEGIPTANSGYQFTGWTVSGASSGNNGIINLGTIKAVADVYTINADGSIVVHTINAGDIFFTANFATATKVNFKQEYTQADYYAWDAYNSFVPYYTSDIPTGPWNSTTSYYNPTTEVSETAASASCKDCATSEQVAMYLGAGALLDEGGAGANQKTFTLPDGNTYHTGFWLKKKAYIPGFDAGTAPKVYSLSGIPSGRPDASVINQYFFLPCTGWYAGSGLTTAGAFFTSTTNTLPEDYGYAFSYWTKSSSSTSTYAYQVTNTWPNDELKAHNKLNVTTLFRYQGCVRFYAE